jgi:hypothetical protein
MEKPLINFRNGTNFLRYHYFYGDFYYILTAFQISTIFTILYGVIDWVIDRKFRFPQGWNIVLVLIISFILSIIFLRLFFSIKRIILIKAGLGASVLSVVLHTGIFLCLESSASSFGLGIILIVTVIIVYILLDRRMGRVNIFPNRISITDPKIGQVDLYYSQMVKVKWMEGTLETNLTPDLQAKKMLIVTPLEYYFIGEDFKIHFFYVMIEMANEIYIIQPASYRNAFAQNSRNGWIETWRWDGTKFPPNGWDVEYIKADLKKKGLID